MGHFTEPPRRLIVAMTGASGSIFGVRLLQMLRGTGIETHLVMSRWAARTLVHETPYTPEQVQKLAERDLAVIVPAGVTFRELSDLCTAAAGPRLESLEPFDVYQGDQLGPGRRSVALRFHFRARERAMTDAEVDAAMGNVIQAVRDAGYDVRA